MSKSVSEITFTSTLNNEEVTLRASDPVSLYTCGPTVYMSPHIGNWRTFIFYDMLARLLRFHGFTVDHVMNITDVGHLVNDNDDAGDDKLAVQAAKERLTAYEIADKYTEEFIAGMQTLNIATPNKGLPRAASDENIAAQQEMVRTLIEKGYTYTTDDGIYFDTTKVADYGKLAGGQSDGADPRIDQNDQKRNFRDFALWKFSPKDQKRDMEWEFDDFGIGFPGWHIECSAIAKKYLGETVTIHAGGIDHIPIHHSNEIAQSEAANEAPLAKIWLHSEFMKVDNQKMSKSLGNVYTLKDIEAKGIDPMAFRLMILQGQYDTETNFSWDILEAAANRLQRLRAAAELRWQPIESSSDTEAKAYDLPLFIEGRYNVSSEYNDAKDQIYKTFEVVGRLAESTQLLINMTNPSVSAHNVESLNTLLTAIDELFGLQLMESTPDITDEQKQMIIDVQSARANKNYEVADELKATLLTQGITLKDISANVSLWTRQTN